MAFSSIIQTGSNLRNVKAEDLPVAKRVYGDLNEDGTINVFDLMHLKNILLKGDKDNKMLKYADVDGDGETSFKDISEMVKYLMTEIGIFEPELELDSDNDGLCDYWEQLLGTDLQNPDSDADGLSDYEEVFITFTNPLKEDTSGDGVNDAISDNDNDGLSNADEIKNNTNPNKIDSDDDKLNDDDELRLGSNPLKSDSDDDYISDYGESKLGTNPSEQCSDGITPDNKRYFEQLMDEEYLSNINTFDNCYSLNVSANMSGYIGEELVIKESGYSNFLSNNNIYGRIIDVDYIRDYENIFDSTDFSYTLNFCLDKTLNPDDYMIFFYAVDDYILLPFETNINENVLSVSYNKPATFCLVNISESSNTFDNEIIDTTSTEDTVNGTVNNGVAYQVTMGPNPIANISYFFEVSDFNIEGWFSNPELRKSIIDSAAQLASDGYVLNINMVFYGKAYVAAFGHGSYKVTINCKSSGDIGDVFLRADEFFSNEVKDVSNASKVYNDVITHSERKSAYNLEYSLYYSFAPNMKKAESLSFYVGQGSSQYSIRIGYMNVKVNSPDIDDFKTCISSNLEPSEKIYTLVKHNKNMIYVKSPFLGFVYSKPEYVKYINDYLSNNETDNCLSSKISKIFCDVPTVGYVTGKQKQTVNGVSQYSDKTGVELDIIEKCLYIPWTGNPGTDDSDGDGIEDYKDADPRCPFDYRFSVAPIIQPVTSDQAVISYLIDESNKIYNRNEPTKKDVTILERACVISTGGLMGQMIEASKHLNHYLIGTGETISDEPFSYIEDTIRGPKIISENLNIVRNVCEETVVDHLYFNSNKSASFTMSDLTSYSVNGLKCEINEYLNNKVSGFSTLAKSLDYFFAIGSCNGTMSFECERESDGKFSSVVYIYLLDYYDFEDSDNQVFLIDDVLTDRDMRKLHECGYAKNYLYIGKLCFKMEWNKGERISSDLDGIKQVRNYLVKDTLVH